MHSGSSGRSKASIFSPDRPTSNSRDLERQSGSRKSKPTRSAATGLSCDTTIPLCGPSKELRVKKKSSEFHPYSSSMPLTRATSDLSLFGSAHIPNKAGSTLCHKKASTSHSRTVTRPPKQSRQPMARTIWSRRLESAGISSEDSQFEALFPKRIRYQSPSESHQSETNTISTPVKRVAEESGLSSAVFRGLNPLFSNDRGGGGPSTRLGVGSGLGYSDGNHLLSASSPPVLPPPSDCSEGITPYPCEPLSDEVERDRAASSLNKSMTFDLRMMTSREVLGSSSDSNYDLPIESLDQQLPLNDITPILNQSDRSRSSERLSHPSDDPILNPIDGLSPEIMRALSEAIKAGLSADELARALRKIDSPRASEVGRDEDEDGPEGGEDGDRRASANHQDRIVSTGPDPLLDPRLESLRFEGLKPDFGEDDGDDVGMDFFKLESGSNLLGSTAHFGDHPNDLVVVDDDPLTRQSHQDHRALDPDQFLFSGNRARSSIDLNENLVELETILNQPIDDFF